MKLLAVTLISVVIFLSSFAGSANSVHETAAAKSCCTKSAATAGKCSHNGYQRPTKDCEKGWCNLMFSCSTCGFIITKQMALEPCLFFTVKKPDTPYIIGILSGYLASGLKPPQV